MINAKTFINELNKVGIEFYTGVPDSLMSEFSKSLHFDFDDKNHVIATNEGSALAMCMGYNLATNKKSTQIDFMKKIANLYNKRFLIIK